VAPIPVLPLLLLTKRELFKGRACLEPFAQSYHLMVIQIAVLCEKVDREPLNTMTKERQLDNTGWSRMDSKRQWGYGVKHCVSYGGNALKVAVRGREVLKEGEIYKSSTGSRLL
jgi:hypothetical protein